MREGRKRRPTRLPERTTIRSVPTPGRCNELPEARMASMRSKVLSVRVRASSFERTNPALRAVPCVDSYMPADDGYRGLWSRVYVDDLPLWAAERRARVELARG